MAAIITSKALKTIAEHPPHARKPHVDERTGKEDKNVLLRLYDAIEIVEKQVSIWGALKAQGSSLVDKAKSVFELLAPESFLDVGEGLTVPETVLENLKDSIANKMRDVCLKQDSVRSPETGRFWKRPAGEK